MLAIATPPISNLGRTVAGPRIGDTISAAVLPRADVVRFPPPADSDQVPRNRHLGISESSFFRMSTAVIAVSPQTDHRVTRRIA